MSKSTRKYLIIAFFIFVAVLANIFAHNLTEYRLLNKLLNAYRTFFYIGLFAAWGVSIRTRVMQPQVRLMLTIISVMMVFWHTLRVFKFRFIINVNLIRYMWYAYYIPLIMIPTIAVLVSLYLGKPQSYKLPKIANIFYVPSIILLLIVLTNDYHQLVFDFMGSEVWSDSQYRYGVIYFSIVAWMIICSVTAIIIMISKVRIPQNRNILWIPLIPFIISIIYTVMFAMNIRIFHTVLGDVAAFFCLVFTSFFESCIICGLIQTNTMYSELFRQCRDISVQIADTNYNVCYSSNNAEPLSPSHIKNAISRPLILSNGKRLHCITINGGYVTWIEDTSNLISLSETLTLRREELTERKSLLEYEYEQEKKHTTIIEQNRLYDLLQKSTQKQLATINELVSIYEKTPEPTIQRDVLARIVVLGTYIKRKKDFILSGDYEVRLFSDMLSNAFHESFHALKLMNIQGRYLVEPGIKNISGDKLILAYDFFEDALEALIDKMHYINVRVCTINDSLRISILTDCTIAADNLKISYPQSTSITDEDGTSYILTLETSSTSSKSSGGETP